MKISIITPYLPNLKSGSAVRAYHLLIHLAQKHDVTLFTIIRPEQKEELSEFKRNVHRKTYAFKLPEPLLSQRIAYYLQNKIPYVERLKNSTFKEVSKYIPADTDIIQLTELNSFSIIEPYYDQLPGIKVLDAHNIDYFRIKSEFDSSSIIRKFAGWPIFYNLKKYEINAIKRVDHILTCSDNDKTIYSQYVDPKKITVIPNGVDTIYFKPQNVKQLKHTVFFMGSLGYRPNAFGLKWYIQKVHPIMKDKYADYRLIITGLGKPRWLLQFAKDDRTIVFKGLVDDVRKEISKAQVCICPIFSGSGTRLKLLEYLSLCKAVVSTSQGAEGLEVTNGINILIANEKNQFYEAIFHIFNNDLLRISIGNKGRDLINNMYEWTAITDKLNDCYSKITKK